MEDTWEVPDKLETVVRGFLQVSLVQIEEPEAA